MTIQWMDIEWFPWYSISNTWVVMHTLWNGKINFLSPRKVGKWYHAVLLYKDKKPYDHRIHRLVALYFLKKVIGKEHVNHIDGNKTNNHVTNLEWVTPSENQLHAFRIWLRDNHYVPSWKNSKLSKKIFQFSLDWVFLWEFFWIHDVARRFNLHTSNIRKCIRWEIKQSGWFIWKDTL